MTTTDFEIHKKTGPMDGYRDRLNTMKESRELRK